MELLHIQHKTKKTSMFVVLLMLFTIFIAWSPLLVHFGLRWSFLSIMLLGTILSAYFILNRKIPIESIIISILIITTALIPSLYWSDPSIVFFTIYLLTALLLFSLANYYEILKLIDYATIMIKILLFGSLLGVVLALVHFPPLYTFQRPNHYSNIYIIPFTFLGGIFKMSQIRPTGIYDEPGAFSFVICTIVYIRHALRMKESDTLMLLALGLITQSISHVVFLVLYLLLNYRKILNIKVGLSLIVLAVILNMGMFKDLIRINIINRFEMSISEDRYIHGDNRSELFFNALDVIQKSPSVTIYGLNPEQRAVMKVGENVLGPIAQNGIYIAWPYYIYLLIGIISIFRSKYDINFIAFILLLLQRPYVTSFGYSSLVILALWVHLNRHRLSIHQ